MYNKAFTALNLTINYSFRMLSNKESKALINAVIKNKSTKFSLAEASTRGMNGMHIFKKIALVKLREQLLANITLEDNNTNKILFL